LHTAQCAVQPAIESDSDSPEYVRFLQ
jgi:hypothetical protein